VFVFCLDADYRLCITGGENIFRFGLKFSDFSGKIPERPPMTKKLVKEIPDGKERRMIGISREHAQFMTALSYLFCFLIVRPLQQRAGQTDKFPTMQLQSYAHFSWFPFVLLRKHKQL
jgi:hypothetical protein